MYEEKEIKEEKRVVLKRVPPGDRWQYAEGVLSPGVRMQVFPTLTDALEGCYQMTGLTKFFMDARKGTVEIVNEVEVEKPVKKFSLYGEDE